MSFNFFEPQRIILLFALPSESWDLNNIKVRRPQLSLGCELRKEYLKLSDLSVLRVKKLQRKGREERKVFFNSLLSFRTHRGEISINGIIFRSRLSSG